MILKMMQAPALFYVGVSWTVRTDDKRLISSEMCIMGRTMGLLDCKRNEIMTTSNHTNNRIF
jgi:hypothetical protein